MKIKVLIDISTLCMYMYCSHTHTHSHTHSHTHTHTHTHTVHTLQDKDVTLKEIKLQWSYPRLDVNVSKGINHLLKSPLCVHPKTGRICVPIDPRRVDEFNPFDVPTISHICHELDQVKVELGQQTKHKQGIRWRNQLATIIPSPLLYLLFIRWRT